MYQNVNSRVDKILTHIKPEETVIDFGCGDGYLRSKHPKTVNVDKEASDCVAVIADLDQMFPDVDADVAVFSGILEWLQFPAEVLVWALTRYPCVIFTYAAYKADPKWVYAISIQKILSILGKINCKMETDRHAGQIIFICRRWTA